MDKRTFLERLQAALAGLPDAERERQLAYYEEMIDDRVEEGMSESEAIAALGPADQLAQRVLRQTPPQLAAQLLARRVTRNLHRPEQRARSRRCGNYTYAEVPPLRQLGPQDLYRARAFAAREL